MSRSDNNFLSSSSPDARAGETGARRRMLLDPGNTRARIDINKNDFLQNDRYIANETSGNQCERNFVRLCRATAWFIVSLSSDSETEILRRIVDVKNE